MATTTGIRIALLEKQVKDLHAERAARAGASRTLVGALIGLSLTGLLSLGGASIAYGELRQTAKTNQDQLVELRADIRELRNMLQERAQRD